ncbi:hypothetical protein LIER_28029 [Lithospermum erythrorhizon]|uniref:Ninja-family protein n=1 Tax=Lithospermum erythrorhizon TaxID=34254 RepID=A0AAV3RE75_LITER
MEDDKSLDLSLGLQPCGGGVDSAKGKGTAPSDEADRDIKLINDFKNFLEGGTVKHDPGLGSQRTGPVKTEENFFNNLSQTPADADSSKGGNNSGFRAASESRSTEVEGEKGAGVGDKRKNFFGEVSQPKKLESEAHHSNLQDKTRVSHISITTEEGSTADNEDVADSEAVGSSSRLAHYDDGTKKRSGSAGPSEMHKEVHRISDSNTKSVEVSGQRMFTISADKEVKFRGISNVQSFPTQTGSMMNLSYSVPEKDKNTAGTSSTSNYQLPGSMHPMAVSHNERAGSQPVIPANMPLMFGYSTVQLPTLDNDNFLAGASIQQQFHTSYGGKGQIGSDKHNDVMKIAQASTPVISHKSESPQFDARGGDNARGNGKQNISVEGSISRMEDDAKGNKMILPSTPSDQPRPDSIPSEYPDIRPGLAADIKFGGSGSCPNLPWVSTTGPGPNGKTISGVTYRFSPTQIKIVCACHGSHMSPEEFIRHASEGQTHPDAGTSTSTVPSSNPAASAQS